MKVSKDISNTLRNKSMHKVANQLHSSGNKVANMLQNVFEAIKIADCRKNGVQTTHTR